ncbi:MAG: RluA family pseudouridine synthase [Candidatus Adiutrix sp.]|jgi:23S rRNA-/tRNA-specific pseudouridylate synthase|nr:RluA family pseudouridine synthase [Candidatus Adiutrix sp.]
MLAPAIIYEDNHLLIVQKAPGWLAQPDGGARPDLLSWAGTYLARRKPGRAFVGLVHRLDRAVGGVTALAKTSKAAARLSRQFREGTADKIYLALVEAPPPAESGRLEQALFRDRTVTRPARGEREGTAAALEWKTRLKTRSLTVLEIKLLSGFKHQIRAQLATLGLPVLGDLKYGSRLAPHGPAIGLWAESLGLDHPTLGRRLTFKAAPPEIWPWNLLDA